MEDRVPLGVLGSWFKWKTTPITATGPSRAPTILPDPRRWAMIFSSDSGASLFAHPDQFPALGSLVQVPPMAVPLMWYFTQVGVLLHGPWWAYLSAAGGGTITEILYEPPTLYGPQS